MLERELLEPVLGERKDKFMENYGRVEEPSIVTKAANFGKAMVKDLMGGRKRLSQEQITTRYEICAGCPLFKRFKLDEGPRKLRHIQDKGTCKKCGCFIHSGTEFPNKLSLATERCPLDKWLPVLE
jgi:hypothetical protein